MIHNQLSHGAELQNGIATAVGLSRELEGVVRLGETLEPNIDPWSQPEWAFLRGERLGATKLFAAAVAAEFGIIGIGNPAGSGNIVVVEDVSIGAGVAAITAQLEVVAHSVITGTVVTTTGMASGRDRRWGSTAGRTFQVSGTDISNSFGIPLEQQVAVIVPAAGAQWNRFTVGVPCILRPGDDLIIVGQTVNISLAGNMKWRERKAFTAELTG